MQIQGQTTEGVLIANPSSWQMAARLFTSEGVLAFWTGTSPAMLRQATYGTLRVGLYVRAKRALGVEEGSVKASPLSKVLAGVSSGSISAAICSPTDLIKVRMQAGRLRGENCKRYRGIIHAAKSIVQEEGVRGLYRGVGPTAARAGVVAAAELGSYDEIKALFRRAGSENGTGLHLKTATLAGLCATAASSPFDVVKSRVMSQPVNAHGRGLLYGGMYDCFKKSLQREGISFMWRGFSANYLNKGPTVVLFFLLYEEIQNRFDAVFDSF